MFEGIKIHFHPRSFLKGKRFTSFSMPHLAGALWVVQDTDGYGIGMGFYEGVEHVRSRYPGVEDANTGMNIPQTFIACGTPFQISVWQKLLEIPKGATRTYGAIAASIGKPLASRAVGSAVGANHLCPLIPCHRVIQKGGALGGFAFGASVKEVLLRGEGVLFKNNLIKHGPQEGIL